MRSSIQRRLLIPIVAIQTATIAAMTAAGVWLSAARNERRDVDRLSAVIDVLDGSSFPLTSRVLSQMHGLSGAHLVASDREGDPVAASDPSLLGNLPRAADVPDFRRPGFQSWRQWPTVAIAGRNYYAARLPARASGAAGGTLLVLYPETTWSAAIWDVAAVPIGLGLAAIALSAQAARWVAERIGRRVHRLRGQVARIADGDFAEIDPGEDQDEIRDLIGSVNQMSRQLRDMRRAIAQAERTQLLAQLAAGFAHQLRNTLTGARLGLQLHAKRSGPGGNDSALEVASRQLALAEEQMRGLLTLGRLELRPRKPTDLAALLRDLESLLGPTLRHARVTLDVEIRSETEIIADVDEPSLRAAVLNLAWNALEAAGPGGRVWFRLTSDGGKIMIEVADDGPGPPAELAPAIFEPFVTGKPEGVGLGLALAQRVVEEHQGDLAWSRDAGRTRFRLNLPTNAAETIAEEAKTADESRPDRG